MEENLPYWSPSREKYWVSYWALQVEFPNISLPMYVDIPDIDVYQIHPVELPEIPEGYTIEWLLTPRLGEDGLYYQDYKFNPIESEV